MLCKNCQFFEILYEPLKDIDFGKAKCNKYDLVTDFLGHGKFNKLSCIRGNADMQYALIKCPICGEILNYTKVRESQGMDGSSYDWEIRCSGCGITKTYPADGFYGREYYTEEEMILKFNYDFGSKKVVK